MTYFDGHRLQESVDVPRVRLGDAFPAPTFPHAKDLAGIFLPYAAGTTLAVATFFSGLWMEGAVRAFMLMAGLCGAMFVGYLMRMAKGQVDKEWKLHEDERRARILPQKRVVEVTLNKTDAQGYHHSETKTFKNPPTRELIVWLWQSRGPDGRIPGERAIEAQFGAGADEQVSLLEQEGFLEKAGLHANAPRRITNGWKAEDVAEYFGCSPAPSKSAAPKTR